MSVGEATMEPPDYPVPMKWTSQPEHKISCSQVGQVANNFTINDQCQTYMIHNTQVNSALMVSIPSFVILLVNHIETVRQSAPANAT